MGSKGFNATDFFMNTDITDLTDFKSHTDIAEMHRNNCITVCYEII